MNTPQEPNIASKADDLTAILKKSKPLTDDEKSKLVALRAEIDRVVPPTSTGAAGGSQPRTKGRTEM
jgi:hypothetical protein